MKQKILDELKPKIIKYVPDIIRNENAQIIHLDHSVEYFTEYRPIILEDVMIALNNTLARYLLEQTQDCENSRDYWLFDVFMVDICSKKHSIGELTWIPNKPLHEQELETLEFLNEKL